MVITAFLAEEIEKHEPRIERKKMSVRTMISSKKFRR